MSIADQRTDYYTAMSNEFVKLMKAKGLLGGKYFPLAASRIDGEGSTEEFVEKEVVEEKKRKLENEEKNTTVPAPKKTKETGGLITSPGIGYMRVADDINEDVEEDEPTKNVEVVGAEKVSKKKKKTAAEYLARPIESKVSNRSAKANLNSFKSKFLTGKKKFAAIQPECGAEQDFMLILKNNLQSKDICNASPTAGKYMIFTRGNIKDQLLGNGIKFDPSTMYMLANDQNYEEEKIDLIDNGVEGGDVEEKDGEEENMADNSGQKKKEKNYSMYNMKAVAKKVFTPGCSYLDSDDDDDED